jgi:hypothetical protein
VTAFISLGTALSAVKKEDIKNAEKVEKSNITELIGRIIVRELEGQTVFLL